MKKSAEKPPTGKKSPKKTADKNTPKKVAVKKAGKDLKAKSKATIKKKTQKEESSDYDMDVDVVERDEQTKAQEKKKTTKVCGYLVLFILIHNLSLETEEEWWGTTW